MRPFGGWRRTVDFSADWGPFLAVFASAYGLIFGWRFVKRVLWGAS